MGNSRFPKGAVEEAARLVSEHGSAYLASKASGIPESTLRRRYLAANVDPAISASMDAVGTMMIPQLAWAKTKSEDGISCHASRARSGRSVQRLSGNGPAPWDACMGARDWRGQL